jgi:hypothetical protein
VIRKKQATYDTVNSGQLKKKQAKYNKENCDVIRKKQAKYNKAHSDIIKEKQKLYNDTSQDIIANKQKSKRRKARQDQTCQDRHENFKEEIMAGPSWICCCCHRRLFKQSVRLLKEKDIDFLLEKHSLEFLTGVILPESDQENFICHNCFRIVKSGKTPSISIFNGLALDDIPEELMLTELETQLIAKTLLFMKIKLLPKSRMGAMLDRVINVPLEDEDLVKTVEAFPRLLSESAILPVKFKRMKGMKNTHMEAFIRPEILTKAILKLKECGHPYYTNMPIKDKFEELFSRDMEDILEEDGNQEDIVSKDSEKMVDHDSDDEEDLVKDPVKRQQAFGSSHTCLVNEDPSSMVVVNSSRNPITKKLNRKSDKSFVVAPGEGKTPTNWMRDIDFDIKAYPQLHPTGQYGLHHLDRISNLSCQQYFTQRLLNKDQRFARCKGYLFMAQQFIERNQLERQIDVAGTKGKPGADGGGVSLTDPFSIFAQIRGTPKYWQKVRNELMAKLEQLGPFQIFFTLSCGELRWSEVFVAIFKEQGLVVEYICDDDGTWSGRDECIIVEGLPLWHYIEFKNINKHDLLREEVLHVTRMFDNRVKSFVKNLLMGAGVDSIPVAFYSYRVEFQARGTINILFKSYDSYLKRF